MSLSLREQLPAAGFGKKKAAEQAERKAKDQVTASQMARLAEAAKRKG